MTRRVVITGGASISALGMDDAEIFANLRRLENKVIRMDEWDRYNQMNTRLACPITFDLPEFPRKASRSMGRVAMLGVLSAKNALAKAGLIDDLEFLHSGRIGVGYGSCIGSVTPMLDFFSMLHSDKCDGITATSYIKCMPQTCAVNIGIYFGLTGRFITANTACTSASQSIGYSYEAIKFGLQDAMLAGGADEMSVTQPAVFDTLFAASVKNDTPKLTPASFDVSRDGLVIGEGSSCLVLEEYEHAKARGAKIYAEIIGYGTNTDGAHVTSPQKDTMQKALELAIEDAHISPDAIGYVNAHGTGTRDGDVAESAATYNAFKQRAVPISTLKTYIGHTLAACGGLEAWHSIQMMHEKWFAPNLNLKNVDPKCAPLDYITGSGREMDVEYIMSNNFAFGGVNTSLIFKKM